MKQDMIVVLDMGSARNTDVARSAFTARSAIST